MELIVAQTLKFVGLKQTPWIDSSTVAANLEIVWAKETVWYGKPIPDPILKPV